MGDEDPNFFFARIFRLETMMHAVGIKKSESDIVQIILRQLPERYGVVKTITLAGPQLTRQKLKNTIRSVYSQRKAHKIAKQWPTMCASAEPSYPHALVVGHGFWDGGPWVAVACFGSSSSCSNTGLATVACHGSSSRSNTGLATVACRGSSSSSNNGLAAAPIFSLPSDRRDNSNRCSNRHGESLRLEVTGRTEVAPYLICFSAVMTGLLKSGFSQKM